MRMVAVRAPRPFQAAGLSGLVLWIQAIRVLLFLLRQPTLKSLAAFLAEVSLLLFHF
jgi:hypothetical protein